MEKLIEITGGLNEDGLPVKSVYFRLQPKSLSIAGHYSETSNGNIADGLHVFQTLDQTLSPDAGNTANYGDELIVIRADEDWDSEDVEGVCIDPEEAVIIGRFNVADVADWWELYREA